MKLQSLPLLNQADIEELRVFDRQFIGFSGGLDSTVLLHCLAQQPFFKGKLAAIHVNHGLSPFANKWQSHCETICRQLGVPLHVEKVCLDTKTNLEARAREARREVFAKYVGAKDCLLLGHHADDQAETVLLNLFRGAGVDGLSGIKKHAAFGQSVILRPFLTVSRLALKKYAQDHQLSWVEDESNQDERFSRNFIRQQLMPLLQKKWPSVTKNMLRTRQHCLDAQHNLQQLAYFDCQQLQSASATLDLKPLQTLPRARLINVVRVWLMCNQVRMPETEVMTRLLEDVCFSGIDANPTISWDSICIRRHRFVLYILPLKLEPVMPEGHWSDFPHPLCVPNSTYKLYALRVSRGIRILPDDTLRVQFRKEGERMRLHGHTKALKKLWQQWNVPVWQRSRIPLLYVNDRLASVVGYAISDDFYGEGEEHLYELQWLSQSSRT